MIDTNTITTKLSDGLNNVSHNKLLSAILGFAGVAITAFTIISLINNTRMSKVLYKKALLDIENYKRLGITLPPKA